MARIKTGQKIPLDKLQTTLSELEKLEEKAKDELSLRESIYFLREKLQSALQKGYSYTDLSEILAKQEIKISAATLKQYLNEVDKQKSNRQRGGTSLKVKQTELVPENVPAATENVKVVKTADSNQKEQSVTREKKPSGRAGRSTRRRTTSESQPKDDIVNEFNQY
ncbi:hypothetical protein [Nostoc sp. MS1]|uniref:hypothetical protein n=1 Tax=Nostoc sp. MS1 TaxID=2764711 RepID=UPI001CC63022|nr:hypothetical protein [Nostoc sp. MS1]BCL35366.1 hypothetical protein NSMS1_18130 [Nostoc sp. MS1]